MFLSYWLLSIQGIDRRRWRIFISEYRHSEMVVDHSISIRMFNKIHQKMKRNEHPICLNNALNPYVQVQMKLLDNWIIFSFNIMDNSSNFSKTRCYYSYDSNPHGRVRPDNMAECNHARIDIQCMVKVSLQ